MCTSGKPLALVSVFFAFLQISLRLLLCRFTLQAESLLGLWPVQSLTDTQELSFKWQGSQEVVDEIEALGHYVDALAAADMQGGTNFFLLVALEAPVSDSALTVLARDHAAFLRTTAMSAEQLPISWGSHVPSLPARTTSELFRVFSKCVDRGVQRGCCGQLGVWSAYHRFYLPHEH